MYNKTIHTASDHILDKIVVYDVHPHFLYWESLFDDPDGIYKFLHYTHKYD